MVHGIGTHLPGYSARMTENLMGALELEVRQEISKEFTLRAPEISNLPIVLREVGPSYRAINPEGVAEWLQIEESSRHEISSEMGQSPRAPMTYARLANMETPTLLLTGGADLLSPPAMMTLVADRIPGCRFEVVPEAGHAAFHEQPDIWNRLVLDFIREHGD